MQMIQDAHQKVTATHLKRNAYLYIRQSTIRQVFENSESTQRQYALQRNAIALGWPQERIIVIDSDLGQSGASAVDREGFQRLVAEVGMGRAGIVLGLEVSRLARNSTDWHRLLEICALTDTLILDEDGVYDPAHFNDRLLLGLKGTMSEAELHVLRARLRGGILNKAKRGELFIRPPLGLTYNPEGQCILDPDQQVQDSLRLLFATFRRTGSAMATVKAFRQQGLMFPRRLRSGPGKGELVWAPLEHTHVLRTLHNPRYAGAFVYGRTRTRKTAGGNLTVTTIPQDQWFTFIPGVHDGYIRWEEFEQNQKRLKDNAQILGTDRRHSPPREGPALLQGLILCGRCGRRMTLRYHFRKAGLEPDYLCQREGIEHAAPLCQHIPGAGIDRLIGDLLVEAISPMTLDVALTVQQELQSRLEEADRLRQKQVERARYEADLAQRRYMKVDPDHRLVADTLEADWNHKLRALTEAEQEYARRREQDRQVFNDEQRRAILSLASDFPRLWRDPNTPDRERKRMVRLLLEDVTLIRDKDITAHVRFKGGATRTLRLPLPLNAGQMRMTSSDIVAEVDRLLNEHTYSEIASSLNERGLHSGEGLPFCARSVARIQRCYRLRSRFDRLRAKGLLTLSEMAEPLGTSKDQVKIWRRHRLLRGHAYNDKNECLFEHAGDNPPGKAQAVKPSRRRPAEALAIDSTQEVQCEA
jgi:DNA invertase Pin-like site-specific DNA recombinase